MLLKQAGRFSEPGVEFASFMGHSLGLRHAVILSYFYMWFILLIVSYRVIYTFGESKLWLWNMSHQIGQVLHSFFSFIAYGLQKAQKSHSWIYIYSCINYILCKCYGMLTNLWLLIPPQAEKLLIPTEKREDFEVFQHWLVMEWMNLKEKCKPLLLI